MQPRWCWWCRWSWRWCWPWRWPASSANEVDQCHLRVCAPPHVRAGGH
jgi:hypothetical protein